MLFLALPSFNEYQAALQNPNICFENFELKNCLVETDLWGLPRVRSGGFALTYKLERDNRKYAVRCFHRMVPDRASRYIAISHFLSESNSEIFIPIRYLPKGIQVHGNWFPVTYMRWIEGDTLEAYIYKNINQSQAVYNLKSEFLKLVNKLEELGLAHGDLSHRNIMVKNNKMLLIDYDGMYVPSLSGRRSCEIGNSYFQHPKRSERLFNANIDHFSEIVIYLALEVLSRKPDLWERYETGGEGLLFKQEDFKHPSSSKLLKELENIEELKGLVANFKRVCLGSVEQVPKLNDFLAGSEGAIPEFIPESLEPRDRSSQIVFSSQARDELINQAGKIVTVVGNVTEVFKGSTPAGQTHYFINFGNWRLDCFTVVIWDEALRLLESMKRDPAKAYLGQWVSVTGILTVFNSRPQITILSPTDIEILSNEDEARKKIEIFGKISPPVYRLPSMPASKPVKLGQTGFVQSRQVNSPSMPQVKTNINKASGSLDQSLETIQQINLLFSEFGKKQDPETQVQSSVEPDPQETKTEAQVDNVPVTQESRSVISPALEDSRKRSILRFLKNLSG
jgi:hypothetical protein